MRVSEATFLRLKRFHLVLNEASKARLSTGAEIIFCVSVSYNVSTVVADVRAADGQEVTIYEVVHDQEDLGLSARMFCNQAVPFLKSAHLRALLR